MLTKGDDYPIHQTSDPIAYAGTDRNFYDRYFFNGYNRDGSIFFSTALGVYPHLNIMDGAFCLVYQGVQHNVRVSRHLGMERMDTRVGPLAVDVIEPLQSLRIRLDENDHGIRADIIFRGRARVVEEPRFLRRIGPRTYMDYTRLTQNGMYEGWIEIRGERIELRPDGVWGTRDRSWGVRPIGTPDSQDFVPPTPAQFFWIWAPLNFDDAFSLLAVNADAQGRPWNIGGVIGTLDDGPTEHFENCRTEIVLEPNSRHFAATTLIYQHDDGGETRIKLTPHWKFYMSGLGYLHPEWGHGVNNGPFAIGYDTIRTDEVTGFALPYHTHIQAFVTAELIGPDGRTRLGSGVLEQLVFGPYEPLGMKGLLDVPGGPVR
ncbi:hypothetical protein [Burkholderia sp. D-99]|uniref:DUF7064 domain-containing protein n=1 Tax=Burkholderia sp. D-99 TaxID=2717316 RepID=UPI001422AF86|nr:hypothetical protein [Burkholderia sp. D-99]NHV25876.1 hypothetical protein [Burkholderia sp. D-99]